MLHVKHTDFQKNEKLIAYVDLIKKWQPKINLIGNETINDIWERHVFDSAQLLEYIDDNESVSDLGSGAGLPGIVLAILNPLLKVRLIEIDKRKCVFLNEVKLKLGLKIEILNQKIEDSDLKTSVITARALTEIENILTLTVKKVTNETRFILLKGEKAEMELKSASKKFSFEVENHPSVTNPLSSIIILRRVKCL